MTTGATGNEITSVVFDDSKKLNKFVQKNQVVIPQYEYLQSPPLTATSASQPIFTAPNTNETFQVVAASVRFGTAGGAAAAITVEVAPAGTAVGSGTAQLSSTLSLTGTANTAVNGTLIASPTPITAGASVNLVLSGTLTGLANGMLTVVLQRTA